MSFLLDTNIVSAYNKRTFPSQLKEWLRRHEGDCFLSIVSIAEMRFGLPGADAPDHAALAERVAQTEIRFMHAIEPLDAGTLTRWKHLLAQLKAANRTIYCEDSLIAATAMDKEHVLVTDNTRHFEPATQFGLKLFNPLD